MSSYGFIEAYYEYLPNFDSNKKCFEFTNDIYREWFGVDRYGDYEVFRRVKYRLHHKKNV